MSRPDKWGALFTDLHLAEWSVQDIMDWFNVAEKRVLRLIRDEMRRRLGEEPAS